MASPLTKTLVLTHTARLSASWIGQRISSQAGGRGLTGSGEMRARTGKSSRPSRLLGHRLLQLLQLDFFPPSLTLVCLVDVLAGTVCVALHIVVFFISPTVCYGCAMIADKHVVFLPALPIQEWKRRQSATSLRLDARQIVAHSSTATSLKGSP